MSHTLGRQAPGLAPVISEITLAHVYRAEVGRSTQWRLRLDTTTNWAITAAAAVISVTFSSVTAPPALLLVGAGLVSTLLVVEARRYRYYDLFARRVRLLEGSYLGALVRREPVSADFHAAFAAELVRPRFQLSLADSIIFRLRRTYWPIVGMLLGAWWLKLELHPSPATGMVEIAARAQTGPIPGSLMLLIWAVSWGTFVVMLVLSLRSPLPPTELRAPARRGTAPLGAAFRGVRPRGPIGIRQGPLVAKEGEREHPPS